MISAVFSKKLLPRVLVQVLPATIVVLLAVGFFAQGIVKETALTEHRARLNLVAAQSSTAISLALQNIVDTAQTLAANDLVINSLIDLSERDRYIPMLFQSLRIRGSASAKVTLADYRGRRIASNKFEIDYSKSRWVEEVMKGREVIRVSAAGMIVAVPAFHANQPEGIIVIEFDALGIAGLLKLPVQADGYTVRKTDGAIVYSSNASFSRSNGGERDLQKDEDWMWGQATIDGFPAVRLLVGDRMTTVLSPVERQEKFLLLAILLSIIAVTVGIVLTALKVTKPINRFIGEVDKVGTTTDLAYQIEPSGSEEFLRLAGSFNTMLSQIENTTTSRDYTNGILNSMSEYMVVVSPDGLVLSGNRAMARALGSRVRDLLGRDISSLLSGDWKELIALVGDDLQSAERQLIVPGRAGIPVEVSATNLELNDGSTENIILVLKDITEQVHAKATLDRHLAELERSNADLEQFAYVASHDLKAPLRAIDNLAGWIEEDVAEHMSEDSREHMSLLRSRVNRLEALLEGLLQYARTGRDSTTAIAVDSRALVGEIVEILGPPESLTIDISDDLPELMTTQAPLQQVFHNLIGNAIKHHDRDDGAIRITGRDLGSHFEFTVSDDGPGIPDQYHQKIFQMFQTLKRRDEVEGSGIGLAVVQKLVRAYGGTIAVVSNADERGTAFRFTWKKHEPVQKSTMEKKVAA